MSNSKALLGFVAGAAVGALAGILLAPDKGSNTRSKISGKAGDLTDSLKNSFNSFVDDLKSTYSNAKDDVETAGNAAKEKVKGFKSDAQSSFS